MEDKQLNNEDIEKMVLNMISTMPHGIKKEDLFDLGLRQYLYSRDMRPCLKYLLQKGLIKYEICAKAYKGRPGFKPRVYTLK